MLMGHSYCSVKNVVNIRKNNTISSAVYILVMFNFSENMNSEVVQESLFIQLSVNLVFILVVT